MSCSGSLEALVERLLARVRELESAVEQQRRVIAEQADHRAGAPVGSGFLDVVASTVVGCAVG